MAKHQLYETGDKDAPYSIKDRNGEVVLALCRICNGAEASLATTCPGGPMSLEQEDAIAAGTLDFIAGQWVNKKQEA
jgi:hypothetical protein